LAYIGGINDLAEKFLDAPRTAADQTISTVWDEPFERAVRWFVSKGVLTHDEFLNKADRLKPKWFTVAQIESKNMLTKIQSEIERALENGVGIREFTDDLGVMFDRLGVGQLEQWHADLVFTQNTQNSFHAGFFEALNDPSVAGEFPYLQYVTMGDEDVRDTHEALNGVIFTREGIGEWYPPNGFRCRCTVIPISAEEAEMDDITAGKKPDFIKRDDRLIPVIPDSGFQANPAESFYDVPDFER
jgi:SPP1 gp7 family putative phage head morphogenesis protein